LCPWLVDTPIICLLISDRRIAMHRLSLMVPCHWRYSSVVCGSLCRQECFQIFLCYESVFTIPLQCRPSFYMRDVWIRTQSAIVASWRAIVPAQPVEPPHLSVVLAVNRKQIPKTVCLN
jgi:hypothetical protein